MYVTTLQQCIGDPCCLSTLVHFVIIVVEQFAVLLLFVDHVVEFILIAVMSVTPLSFSDAMMILESRLPDTEDVANHERRVTRAEEQVVRSARTVYSLNQQVAQFQDDLRKLNLRSADESKKVFDTCMWIKFQHFFGVLLLLLVPNSV